MKPSYRLKTAVSLLLFILLLGSLGLNGYLFLKAKQYYLELNGTRLDPLGLSYFPIKPENIANDNGEITAVFFGDSRAAQWPNPPGVEGVQFINRGIVSQTSVQVAGRFQQHVAPLQPDLIILQMCINDLKTIPLFPQNEQVIIENCLANIDQVLAAAEQLGAKVILTTVFPVGDVPLERRIVWSEEIGEAVTAVNEQIYTKASENVLIFDAFSILVDERGVLKTNFSKDELHLNDEGYLQLNEKFLLFFETIEIES